MAAQEIYRNEDTQYCAFSIDNENDLELLPTTKQSGKGMLKSSTPCIAGSVAKSIEGKRYIINSNDEWKTVTSIPGSGASSGVGGEGIEDVAPIDHSTIFDLFK